MARYVYILSTHDEYGAENVRATLNRSDLPALLRTYGPELVTITDEALKLAFLLGDSSDEDLATSDGQGLSHGWGGLRLNVVKLYEAE